MFFTFLQKIQISTSHKFKIPSTISENLGLESIPTSRLTISPHSFPSAFVYLAYPATFEFLQIRTHLKPAIPQIKNTQILNQRLLERPKTLLNALPARSLLNCLKFQQYLPLQQYYQTPRMSDSSNTHPQPTTTTNPKSSPLNPDLSKFKPWVFRPKKVVYSLDDMAPTKKEFSTSHWNEEENQKYMDFLMRFREVIEGEKKRRRKWHLNRIMSKHIGSRSHEQCRSHHQKMIKNYKTIEGILSHLQGNSKKTAAKMNYDPPSTSLASPEEHHLPFNIAGEESIFNIFDNALDCDSSYIRIPFFCREESDDLF